MTVEINREKMIETVKSQYRSKYTFAYIELYDVLAEKENHGLPYEKELKQLYAATVGAIAATGLRGVFRTSERIVAGKKAGWDNLRKEQKKSMLWAMEIIVDAFYMAYIDEIYDRADAERLSH